VSRDRTAVLRGAKRVHNIVDYIVAPYAGRKPANSKLIALEVGGRMPELLFHKRACKTSLVVSKERLEAWVGVSDAGNKATVVEWQVLDRLKDQFGWDTRRDQELAVR
jgi:hypothetical protein